MKKDCNSSGEFPYALWVRATALGPCVPPKCTLNDSEEKLYNIIKNAAALSAECKNFCMSLEEFNRTPTIDEWLKYDGFKIVSGESGDFLSW